MANLPPNLDQRLANLGQLQDEHPYTEGYHSGMRILVLMLMTFGLGAVGLNLAYSIMNNQWRFFPFLLVLSLPFLGGGIWLWQKAQHDKKLRFLVYEDGLVYHTHNRTDVVRWDEVETLWLNYEKNTSRSSHGVVDVSYSFYKIACECMTSQGSALKFKHRGGDVERFGELIERINGEIVTQRKVPEYKAMLARGAGVEFGDLTVTPTGFATRKKTIAWEEIETVYFTLQSLSINQKGRWGGKSWQSFPLKKLPNAFAIPMIIAPYVEVNGGD